MLAMVERIEHDAGAGLDRARHFHDDINGVAARQHRRVVGQDGHSASDRCLPPLARS